MKQDVGSAMKLDIINKYLKEALKEAYKAYDLAECPIGAIIVKDNKVEGVILSNQKKIYSQQPFLLMDEHLQDRH